MEKPKALGEAIREIRQAKNMSMRDLARDAGLRSVAFIADLERGFRNPSPEVLVKLARGLGVPPQHLRGFDQRPPVEEIRSITEKDPEWAMAFREVVERAGRGDLTPRKLMGILNNEETQMSLNIKDA